MKPVTINDLKIGVKVLVQGKSKPWKGFVSGRIKGSVSKVMVKESDRGVGWDETSKTYKGIRFKGGWSRGENKCFGQEYPIHKNQITLI